MAVKFLRLLFYELDAKTEQNRNNQKINTMSEFSNAVVERIRLNLFATPGEMAENGLKEEEQTRIIQLRDVYNYWIAYPTTRERDILKLIEDRYGHSRQVAYKYVALLRSLLADLGKVSKDYIRFQFNEMIRDAYDEAKKAGNIDAMVKALGQYAKYNQLDKEDVLDTRWETFRPQQFIMTDDPTVIGFKPIPNIREKIKATIHRYWNEQIEDVRFVEANDVNELMTEGADNGKR